MRYRRPGWIMLLVLGTAFACNPSSTESNPYLSYTDTYGVAGTQQSSSATGGGAGVGAAATFRQNITVTFRNNHPSADLNTTFVAWVNLGSIRSAQQQDALLASGYVQLTQAVTLGTAFTLPVGTFVYGGSGTAGATAIFLTQAVPPTTGGTNATFTPTTTAITLNTPDVILVFDQPPVSCESVAFYYTRDGEPLTSVPVDGATGPYGGSNTTGAFKTLAQMNVYECSPLQPGLFFTQTGGGRRPNQYLEGQDITIDFNPTADANGNFGIVTIGTVQPTTQPA